MIARFLVMLAIGLLIFYCGAIVGAAMYIAEGIK
jgi:hypothetical protein